MLCDPYEAPPILRKTAGQLFRFKPKGAMAFSFSPLAQEILVLVEHRAGREHLRRQDHSATFLALDPPNVLFTSTPFSRTPGQAVQERRRWKSMSDFWTMTPTAQTPCGWIKRPPPPTSQGRGPDSPRQSVPSNNIGLLS